MRRQLNLVALAVSSMVVVAFIVPLGIVIRNQTADRALAGAQRDAQAIATAFAVSGGTLDAELVDVASGIVSSLDQSGRVSVVFDDDTVVGAQFELEDSNLGTARLGNAFTAEFEGGAEVLVPVNLAAGVRPVVRSYVTSSELRDGVYAAWGILTVLGVALIGASLFIADRLGRSIVAPVRSVSEATREFGRGNRAVRVPVEGPPEVAEVAEEFNHLADRFDALLQAERESVADLSHRLRTPLASLRLQTEALPGDASAAIRPEVERLEQAVTQLIEEARQSGDEPQLGPTDLTASVRHRIDFWRVLAADQERRLTAELPKTPIWVGVPQGDLGAAVDTLIENVFSHTPAGSPFRVSLQRTPIGANLVVEDTGPGFTDPAVVERGESRSGSSGLGLDIVYRCAEASGGKVTVENRMTGGARVTAVFGTVD